MALRLVLVGAGHAHLHVLSRVQILRDAGIDLHLISPATFLDSGLATGALSGALDLDAGQIDVAALAAAQRVRHDLDRVSGVDLAGRQARLAGGGTIDFDMISFNVGSTVADPQGLRVGPGVWPVKPLASLLRLRGVVEATINTSGRCPAIVIAGAGQTAFEVAAALCGLCERRGVGPHITVVGPDVDARWAPERAARRLLGSLRARGVEFRADRVVARGSDACELASGLSLACEALVLATGLVATDLMRTLDLPTDQDGRLRVSSRLQALGNEQVFAVGDCGILDQDPRPCVGVFGVRAAPILVQNLVAFAKGERLAAYRPQRRWLSIMDLGDGTGLALRGRFWWLGRTALHLKRWLDLGFVRRAHQGAAPIK